jgi:hypothetical protein
MVDNAAVVDERFLIEVGKEGQHGRGDRDGEVKGEGGGGVDELHSAVREDGGCEGSDGECDIPQSDRQKGKSPRVKTRAGHIGTPSKKMRATTEGASPSGQPSHRPSSNRGGI